MLRHDHVFLACIALLLMSSLCAGVSGAVLAQDWKDHPYGTGSFTSVKLSTDGSTIFAGGNQLLFRTWTGDERWGGLAGTIAAMSDDGNYIFSAPGTSVVMYGRNGIDIWTRNMDKPILAVAISGNGSFVVEADNSGLMQSWAKNGDFIGRNSTALVKSLAISRDGSLVVAATDRGLKFYTPALNLIWEDTNNGSLDQYIAISDDGSTVITAGGPRVSSHAANGQLNWMKDFTTSSITDMAASGGDETIVVGDQNGQVHIINSLGIERQSVGAGRWVNAVGVSDDGKVIAAGSIDQTLYVFDGSGNVLATKSADSIIQQHTVAVNSDGSRIVFADRNTLYGNTLRPETQITPQSSAPSIQVPVTIVTTYPTPVTPSPGISATKTIVPTTTQAEIIPDLPLFAIAISALLGIRKIR